MTKLSTAVGDYLLAQARAGAQALQLFDSWCGELSPADYAANVLPYYARTIEIARSAGVSDHPLRRQYRRTARAHGLRSART